jgi:hypothetical protein
MHSAIGSLDVMTWFNRYPDATAVELAAADHTCVICREELTSGKKYAGAGGGVTWGSLMACCWVGPLLAVKCHKWGKW